MNASPVDAARATGVDGRLRRSILLRSLLLQSVWNPRGMQSVGFCFSMLPVLGRMRLDREGRSRFLKRHLSFFNTNPGLSCYVLGAVAEAELSGKEPSYIQDVKRSLGGPLGMAGDALLWGAVRPLAGLVGVLLAMMGAVWALFVLLAIYNLAHLAFRVRGITAGAVCGAEGARELLGPGYRRSVALVRGTAAFAAGLVLAFSLEGSLGRPPAPFVAAALFLAAWAAVRARVPVTVVGAVGALAGVWLMIMGSNGG